jgi:hypothetical protein
MNRSRIIAAFLVSPLAAILYLFSLSLFFHEPLPRHVEEIVAAITFLALIGFVAEIGLGLPMLLLFWYFRLLKLPWLLAGGLLIGSAVFAFFGGPVYRLQWGLIYCVGPTLISTVTFWFIGLAADNKSLDRSHGERVSHQA